MVRASFLSDERGDIAPASYIIGVVLTLIIIFFTLDLGVRKGARLAVEYAAYCGARAAATQVPAGDNSGACLSESERGEIELAVAACLASVVSKRGTFGLGIPGTSSLALDTLISRARKKIDVRIKSNGSELSPGRCAGHNDEVTVEVTYDHDIPMPLSPFFWGGNGHTTMVAQASAMLHTVK